MPAHGLAQNGAWCDSNSTNMKAKLLRALEKLRAGVASLMGVIPNFVFENRRWTEHGVDVMTLIATIVLAFLIHSLDAHGRVEDGKRQESAQQRQEMALNKINDTQTLALRQNGAENGHHQAFTLFAQLEEEIEPGHIVGARDGGQWRVVRPQQGQPTKDVGIRSAEISQEMPDGSAIGGDGCVPQR